MKNEFEDDFQKGSAAISAKQPEESSESPFGI
jgi:hypothetical protein